MKKLILLTIMFAALSCSAQQKTSINNKNNKNNKTMSWCIDDSIPVVTKSFERFDQALYDTREKGDIWFSRLLSDGTYIEVDDDCYEETPPNSYFTIFKLYYLNGNIKKKGLKYNSTAGGDFRKGVWYEFDEQGNLVKETDYDKDYAFTWEDIIFLCHRENIHLTRGYAKNDDKCCNQVYRKYSEVFKRNCWYIDYKRESEPVKLMVIDGNTGEILTDYIQDPILY